MTERRAPASTGALARDTASGTRGGRADASTGSDVPTGSAPELGPAGRGPACAGPCPRCGVLQVRGNAYCEGCGSAFAADARAPDSSVAPPWAAVVTQDRAYFNRVAAGRTSFPAHTPPRHYVCAEPEIRIGRRSRSPGAPRPHIDLAEPPEDPAISLAHAILLRAADGRYSLIDVGSTNGTTVNEGTTPIPAEVPIALNDGDRIHIGAWTTITLVASSRPSDARR